MQSIKEGQPFENCITSDPKPLNPEVKKIKFKLFGIQNVIKEKRCYIPRKFIKLQNK